MLFEIFFHFHYILFIYFNCLYVFSDKAIELFDKAFQY